MHIPKTEITRVLKSTINVFKSMQQNIFNGEVAVYFQTPLYMVLKTSDQKGGSYI